ncbi:MAG: hypothetical protein WC766_03250 [Patescibacteria group bacterium]|jgi:hypothetical protein
MPVLITPKPRSTPNPDGSNSPNPQDRIAQLEAELSSAEAEIGKLATANVGLQAWNVNLQAKIEGISSQEKTLREAHGKELKQRDDSIASLKQQYDGLVLLSEDEKKLRVEETERSKRHMWIALICLAAVLLLSALGFGLVRSWEKIIGSPTKESPTETVVSLLKMDPKFFGSTQFFMGYDSPNHYCGEKISIRGKIGIIKVSTPTIDCTENGYPTSDAQGCKDISKCEILVEGTYPDDPYEVVDRREMRCWFEGQETCRVLTLRIHDEKKE